MTMVKLSSDSDSDDGSGHDRRSETVGTGPSDKMELGDDKSARKPEPWR